MSEAIPISPLRGSKVLVTGSSGFIGTWVCRALRRAGAHCIQLDKAAAPGLHVHQVDLLDESAMQKVLDSEQPKYVVHLAARCDLGGTSLEDYSANTEGVRILCRSVRRAGSVKRVIFTSSQLVCRVGYEPQHDDEYCPDTTYGRSKVVSEQVARAEDGGGCEWCLTRPTTAWGPGMSPHYRQLIRYIEKGRYFHSGPGALFKSYGYVENMAYQYLKLLEAAKHEIHQKTFYLADYDPLSLRAYTNGIARELGVKDPITIPLFLAYALAFAGDALKVLGLELPYNSFRLRNIRTEYTFDLSDTRRVCGDIPKDIPEGIRETVKWYRSVRSGVSPDSTSC